MLWLLLAGFSFVQVALADCCCLLSSALWALALRRLVSCSLPCFLRCCVVPGSRFWLAAPFGVCFAVGVFVGACRVGAVYFASFVSLLLCLGCQRYQVCPQV
jgi:hypothetical protein